MEVKNKDHVMLALFGRSVPGCGNLGGCVPFVHNGIIGAEIAGKQTSISLRPPGESIGEGLSATTNGGETKTE